MALRSLVRKMPALGVRSWPSTGPVHKLSSAAGSRLMSTNLPSAEEGQQVYSREEINLLKAQYKQGMKELDRTLDACAERPRRDAEYFDTFRKGHEEIRKTCYVILLLYVPAAILTYVYST